MNILTFTKQVQNIAKMHREIQEDTSFGPLYNYLINKDDLLEIHFTDNLTQQQIDDCTNYVNTFVEVSVHDNLFQYLKKDVGPFIEDMMDDMSAENIEMGITATNMTTEVLGFFEQQWTGKFV